MERVPRGAGGVADVERRSRKKEETANRGAWPVCFRHRGLGFKQEAPEGLRKVKPVLLDTGCIVALLDRSERHHPQCKQKIQGLSAPLITCEAVIAEACYLVRHLRGASEAILDNVRSGVFQIPLQLSQEAGDVTKILGKYRDREIDLADACLIVLANRYEAGAVLTLDKDFQVYRWGRNKAFELLLEVD